ncbi:hypothetical protein N8D56_00230 [Devosia sp. A8/3-2]|nr:hypothetical protein N8D56_00230 [Devosia sp. A8/3-2]
MRLAAQSSLLAGIFGVFFALVLFGWLPVLPAIIAFLAIVVGMALLPVGTVTVTKTVPAPAMPSVVANAQIPITAFADALTDPCFVLDRRAVVVHANAGCAAPIYQCAAGQSDYLLAAQSRTGAGHRCGDPQRHHAHYRAA